MKTKVYDILDQNEWEKYLDLFPDYKKEAYYLPQYLKSWENYENAKPLCFFYENDGFLILYPFFKKKISGFNLNNEYYDIQSAYGYGGPITSAEIELPNTIINDFNNEFDKWCEDNAIIAEFIRMNPSFHQQIRKADYSKIRNNVHININNNFELSKRARSDINLAKNKNLTIEIDHDLNTLNEFINLYNITADRLQMDDYYYFNTSYFQDHKRHLSNYSKLINIRNDKKLVATAIILYYGKYGSIHLAASDLNHKNLRPNDLLYDACINELIKCGVEKINLGGGTSLDPMDGLFRFKKKFGNEIMDVFIGCNILNNVYYELIEQWKVKFPKIINKYEQIFLKYRYNS